jgi:hypothetical protein
MRPIQPPSQRFFFSHGARLSPVGTSATVSQWLLVVLSLGFKRLLEREDNRFHTPSAEGESVWSCTCIHACVVMEWCLNGGDHLSNYLHSFPQSPHLSYIAATLC